MNTPYGCTLILYFVDFWFLLLLSFCRTKLSGSQCVNGCPRLEDPWEEMATIIHQPLIINNTTILRYQNWIFNFSLIIIQNTIYRILLCTPNNHRMTRVFGRSVLDNLYSFLVYNKMHCFLYTKNHSVNNITLRSYTIYIHYVLMTVYYYYGVILDCNLVYLHDDNNKMIIILLYVE